MRKLHIGVLYYALLATIPMACASFLPPLDGGSGPTLEAVMRWSRWPGWLWFFACLYALGFLVFNSKARNEWAPRLMGLGSSAGNAADAAVRSTFFLTLVLCVGAAFFGMTQANSFSSVTVISPQPAVPISRMSAEQLRLRKTKDYAEFLCVGLRLPFGPASSEYQDVVGGNKEFLWVRGTLLPAGTSRALWIVVILQVLAAQLFYQRARRKVVL